MYPVGMDRSAPRGRVVGRMQYAPTCSLPPQGPSVDARMRYAPTGTRPNLAGIPDAFSALLSDSIFAAVFGDAKSDGPVRDVKRESSEMLEQCPLL